MFNLIAVASLLCLALEGGVLLLRRRRVGVDGLDNVSVSHEWLLHHRTSDGHER